MFVELHIIQNFAPSCLNRDDTNAPKDCVFGGYRRARISSQCLKRTVRFHPAFRERLNGALGTRTKSLLGLLSDRIEVEGSKGERRQGLEALIRACGLSLSDEKTEYLLYLGDDVIDKLARLAEQHWANLVSGTAAPVPEVGAGDKPAKKGKKSARKKADAMRILDEATRAELVETLTGASRAADIGLFGRMVADLPTMNVDAACQVAHAISTHEIQPAMDFYTAVDDLQPKDETGAGMMGMVEFNSACFYRYALVTVPKLLENLGGDAALALGAVIGFIHASVLAIPTGKQNTFAAFNPPELVYVSIRDSGLPRSLASAFTAPVRPRHSEGDLVAESIAALGRYRTDLNRVYGNDDAQDFVVCTRDLPDAGFNEPSESLDDLLERVSARLETSLGLRG